MKARIFAGLCTLGSFLAITGLPVLFIWHPRIFLALVACFIYLPLIVALLAVIYVLWHFRFSRPKDRYV